jgi:hypothetical protein
MKNTLKSYLNSDIDDIVGRCAILENQYRSNLPYIQKSIVDWADHFENVLLEDKQFIRECYGE